MSPSDAAKRRGLITLLADTFLMWGGFFMVVPLISVHFVDGLGWAAASIGTVLAVRQLAQQGLSVFGGAVADRVGARGLILAGLLLRGVGFASMAWATSFPLLLASGLLAGLGGALFEAPRAAAITALVPEEGRRGVFALAGTIGNLGMTLGVLAGGALLQASFGLVALVAGACYFLTFLVTLVFLPEVRVSEGGGERVFSGLGLVLRDRTFLLYTLVLTGYWLMWVQLSLSLPLEAKRLAGTSAAVGWVFTLNALLSVALQYPLARAAERRMRPMPTLVLGVLLMAAGLGLVAVAGSTGGLLACVVLFSLGGLLAAPSQQVVAAELASPAALGSYFGFGSLALAVGGGAGNLAGGVLHDLARSAGLPALPWLAFGGTGAATALALVALDRWMRSRERQARQEPVALAQEVRR